MTQTGYISNAVDVDLTGILAEGARSKGEKFRTLEEWKSMGLMKFKRRVLGLCGQKTTKSIDELANILYELGAVKSLNDGRELVPKLYGVTLNYGGGYLTFMAVQNSRGEAAIRIKRSGYVYDDDFD